MGDIFGFDACLTLFGVVAGNGRASDGSSAEIDIDIPPVGYETQRGFEDYEPPNINVKDLDINQNWFADGGNLDWLTEPPLPGESQVDSYTSDGSRASGTATFIDVNALSEYNQGKRSQRPESVDGTFEVHCAS